MVHSSMEKTILSNGNDALVRDVQAVRATRTETAILRQSSRKPDTSFPEPNHG